MHQGTPSCCSSHGGPLLKHQQPYIQPQAVPRGPHSGYDVLSAVSSQQRTPSTVCRAALKQSTADEPSSATVLTDLDTQCQHQVWRTQHQQQPSNAMAPWQRRQKPSQQLHAPLDSVSQSPASAAVQQAQQNVGHSNHRSSSSGGSDQPYVPADTAAGRNRQITAHISKRKHWTQLQQIWLDTSDTLTPIHLTAIITRLARLVESQGVKPSDRPELFKFSSAIVSLLGQTLDDLDSRGAAQTFWAYAKLQSHSPHSSRTGDAAAAALAASISQHHVQQLKPQELSQVAWAVAILQPAGLQLPVSWWPGLEQRLLLLLPRMQPQEVACCAWAAAKTQHTAPKHVIQAMVQQTAAEMATYGVRELVQVVAALAAWGSSPPRYWMEAMSSRFESLSPSMQPLDISSSLLALAQLSRAVETAESYSSASPLLSPQPPAAAAAAVPVPLVRNLLSQLLLQLPSSCPRVLVSVSYALAKLGLNPGCRFWATFLPYTAASLHCCSPSGLAILAWSLARLGVNPGQGWLQEFMIQSAAKIQGFAAQELSMFCWGLGRWGAEVGSHWWEGFEQVSGEQMEDFTAAELAALLCGVAGATLPPPAAAAEGLAAGVQVGLTSQLQVPQQQSQQQQQGYAFSKQWTSKLLAAAESSLSGAPSGCLAGIVTGLAKLNIRPSSSWLAAFEAAAAAAIPEASLGNAAAILWAYAVFEVQPSSSLLFAVNARIRELLQQYFDQRQLQRRQQQQQQQDTPKQWGMVRDRPDSTSSSYAAAHPSPATVGQLLWALGHLRVPVGAPWIDDLLLAAAPRLASATSYTLVTMIRALAKLGHAPGCRTWVDIWWAAYAPHLQQLQNVHCPSSNPEHSSSSSTLQWQPQERQQYLEEEYTHPTGQIAAVLWSLGRLGVVPRSTDSSGGNWLQSLLDVSQPLLCTASVLQLWGVLSQLVHLHVWPGDSWLAAAADALLKHQQRLQQQQQAMQPLSVIKQQQQQQEDLKKERSALVKALRHLERLGCLVKQQQLVA